MVWGSIETSQMEHFQTGGHPGQHLGGGRVLWDVPVAVGFLAQKAEQV